MCQVYSVCSSGVWMTVGYMWCGSEMLAAIFNTGYLRGQHTTGSLLELLDLQDCEREDYSIMCLVNQKVLWHAAAVTFKHGNF